MKIYEFGTGHEKKTGSGTADRILCPFHDDTSHEMVPAMCRLDYTMTGAGGTAVFVRKYTLAPSQLSVKEE